MTCADCRDRPVYARGLCKRDYRRHERAGTLIDWPTKLHMRDDLLEDYAWLKEQGYTRGQIAERLRMKRDTLDKALARAADDPRSDAQPRRISA